MFGTGAPGRGDDPAQRLFDQLGLDVRTSRQQQSTSRPHELAETRAAARVQAACPENGNDVDVVEGLGIQIRKCLTTDDPKPESARPFDNGERPFDVQRLRGLAGGGDGQNRRRVPGIEDGIAHVVGEVPLTISDRGGKNARPVSVDEKPGLCVAARAHGDRDGTHPAIVEREDHLLGGRLPRKVPHRGNRLRPFSAKRRDGKVCGGPVDFFELHGDSRRRSRRPSHSVADR